MTTIKNWCANDIHKVNWFSIVDRAQPNATFKEQDDNQPDIYEARKRHSLVRDKEVKKYLIRFYPC